MKLGSHNVLFSLLYLALLFSIGVLSSSEHHYYCDQAESLLLLQFIKQFVGHKKLGWNERSSSDCCKWEGVTCDTSTGHVIGLDLNSWKLQGPIHRNSTLFQLHHLQNLNLAYPNALVNEIGSLTSLTHLNLSNSWLFGTIPSGISHLSKLVSLDLSSNYDLHSNDSSLLFLHNLTKLEVLSLSSTFISCSIPRNISASLQYLDLSVNNIIGSIPDRIFQLSELQSLDLSDNINLVGSLPKFSWSCNHTLQWLDLGLTGIFGELPNSIGNLRSLNYLSLSGDSSLFLGRFFGSIPESIGNLTHLKVLNLRFNSFKGSVPFTVSNLNQLTTLDLSNNCFEGEIPDVFSSLQKITALDLQENNFTGLFPTSIVNLTRLEILKLERYSLLGSLPSIASGLQNLRTLSLSGNALNGRIPSWIFNIPFLTELDLSQNQFAGQLPEISSESLVYVFLSNNQLDGQIPPSFLRISMLDLSFNPLSWSNGWTTGVNISDSRIEELRLSSCEIRVFLGFIRNVTSLRFIDLSNNQMEGQIPNWFTSMNLSEIKSLDFSQNRLIGDINQLLVPNIVYLDLHSNQLQGPLTITICNSSSLQLLNLKYNKFNGSIPQCLGEFDQLSVLDLGMNNFIGIVPTMLVKGCHLTTIALNGNQLEGSIPKSLVNCTELEVLDLGNNKLIGTFPNWLGYLQELKILILSSNKFYGPITPLDSKIQFSKVRIFDLSYNSFSSVLPKCFFNDFKAMINVNEGQKEASYLDKEMYGGLYNISINLVMKGNEVQLKQVLTIFTTIDLSSNQFEGEIPMSIGNLNSLLLLNLSHNCFNGSIPRQFGEIKLLESQDISWNQLTEKIPEQLTSLTFLEVLNLSQNHLVGPIPTGKQFNTFENDSYGGNTNLCGFPLSRDCNNNGRLHEPRQHVEQEEKSDFLSGFTWRVVVIGFGCGMVFGILIENIMSRIGKPEWFVNFFYGGNRRRKPERSYGRKGIVEGIEVLQRNELFTLSVS